VGKEANKYAMDGSGAYSPLCKNATCEKIRLTNKTGFKYFSRRRKISGKTQFWTQQTVLMIHTVNDMG